MSNTKKKKSGSSARTGKRSSTSAASRGTARTSSAGRRKAGEVQEDREKKAFLLREAGFVFLLFAALFLLIANFGILGSLGQAVSGFQKGLLGYNAYLFPVVLVCAVFYFAKEKHGFLFGFKVFSVLLLIVTVSAMIHLAAGAQQAHTFREYFEAGKNGDLSGMAAGGALGGFIGDALRSSMASTGAWLLLGALFILCIVVISEKSIVGFAKRRAEQASELAHSGTEYARTKFSEEKIRREAKREAEILRRKEEAMDRDLRSREAEMPSPDSEAFDLSRSRGGDVRAYAGTASRFMQEDSPELPGEFADPRTGTDEIRLSDANREETQDCSADPASGQPTAYSTQEEPDYDVDEVPFAETEEDRYKAYGRILASGNIDMASAEQMGFAVSRNTGAYRNAAAAAVTAAGAARPEPFDDPDRFGYDGMFGEENGTELPETDILQEEPAQEPFRRTAEKALEPDHGSLSGVPAGYDDYYHISDEQRDSVYDERKKAAARETAVTSFAADAREKVQYSAAEARPQSAPAATASAAAKAAAAAAKPAEPAARPIRKRPYQFPPVSLLKKGVRAVSGDQNMNRENARKLEMVLANFGVKVTVTNIVRGPRVTRYEMTPDEGVRVSKITSLAGDIKLALAASDLRIEAPIPGKSAVGIEVPNEESATVTFRDIMETQEFRNSRSRLAWGVGLDIQGAPVVGDIAKMPHLLVSGTTGSGKSVGINSIIMSVIYRAKPEEVKMILVDPKVVELSVYDGIPHLLAPVVTKPDKALAVLNKACAEMEERYRRFKESNTRNIVGYNEKIDEICAKLPEGAQKPEKMPYILIIIDELSELMMHSKRDVESAIVSLTQLARAAGIHLVVATQRPSVDVVTGLIKSNIPSRVAYRLPSGIDSRTILDTFGAETLLGNGDMLYKPGNVNNPIRVQGAYLSDSEVEQVVDWLKKHNSVFYEDEWENVKAAEATDSGASGEGREAEDDGRDEYFVDAGILITEKKKASIGALQRKFKVGFNRASRIMEQLNEAGVVSEGEGTKERMILMSPEEFREKFVNG